MMKSNLLLTLFLTFVVSIFSQEKITKYSKAKIFYTAKSDMELLLSNGIAVDHGIHKKNIFIESIFSSVEISKAKQLGFKVAVIIDDMQKHIAERKQIKNNNNASCQTVNNSYVTPVNFELGSMGGFYTYAQMLQELDDMHALYPNLITVKTPIDTYVTFENRPIYSVKISDNPTMDEAEPEMLFSAIHHAREPASMQQLIFYMWYLLENYTTNTEIQAIVDNTEQFFIPVLNVDGYIYNETTNPNGGGYWRKNRRNNGDGSFGVDNNRNYSYHWNELGVSSSPNGQTWPGTASFSEPENQAMKWFCEQHNFVMVLNNHSYSGLLLYPFGYETNTPTVENALFDSISELMVSQNGYVNQISADLYPASGNSDDWMYADTSTKNKIYAMTPEVGYSFWPAENTIIPLCKSMQFHNITAAHLITNYATLEDKSPTFISSVTGNFEYSIKRLGLQEPANFTVSIVPISSNITNVGSMQSHNTMSHLQTINAMYPYTLDANIQPGDSIEYKLIVNNGSFNSEQIITKIFGTPQVIFTDLANSVTNYNATSWDITISDYYSANSSITDSPVGNYGDNLNNFIELTNAIDLSQATNVNVSFYAKWDIETAWDYVQFEISKDNGATWIAQCGKYTKHAVPNQGIGSEPMYDGLQNNWVKEEINLSDYLGEQIKFRFQLFSDGNTTKDGFYFDDFKVEVINANPAVIIENELAHISIYPNPVTSILTLEIPNINDIIFVKIYTVNGQLIQSKEVDKKVATINMNTFSDGVYFVKLESNHIAKMYRIIKK